MRFGLSKAQEVGELFCWLCVTNAGAERINRCALGLLGVTEEQLAMGYRGDPKAGAGNIFAKPGLCLRLTRNLDKERGFVNGAIGVITTVLDPIGRYFVVKLSTGTLVLVYPVKTKQGVHLPCSYGYATTMRKAQGSSLSLCALFFDHVYPPERGYGYVGASRFRSADGLYHFGRLRRSDWRPVGGDDAIEASAREGDSANSDSGDEAAMERDAEYDSMDESDVELGRAMDECGSDSDDAVELGRAMDECGSDDELNTEPLLCDVTEGSPDFAGLH